MGFVNIINLLSLHPLIKIVVMSVLESIRKRTGLLVGIVGLAIIVFILQLSMGDGVGMPSVFGGDNENSAGSINGTNIDAATFQQRVNEVKAELTRGQEPNEQQRTQAINQAWEDLIRELVYEKEYEKLGIVVTKEEMYDQMLVHPHNLVVSQFRDPQTGQLDQRFSPDGVNLNVGELNKLVAGFKDEQLGMWAQLEKYVKMQRMVEKYLALVKGGLYVTTAETKMNFANQNTTYDVRFVLKPYTDIADAEIKVSDQDIQEYYNNNLFLYQNETPSRSIEYVVWDIVPSPSDIDTMKAELERVKAEFATIELNEDSAFTQSENNGQPDVNSYARERLSLNILRVSGKNNFRTL